MAISHPTTESIDIGLGLENTHVLITGAGGQIGQVVVKFFLAAGAYVSAWDIDASRVASQKENHDNQKCRWDVVDVTDENRLDEAYESARLEFGLIATCIALAGLDLSFIPHCASMADMLFEDWRRTLSVNCDGTFLTARGWLRGVRSHANDQTRNISLIIIGSEAGLMGVRSNCDYATSKAGIQTGLVLSMAPDAANIHPRARVNALAPGPVDTSQFRKECEDDAQAAWTESVATVALKSAVPIEAIARACLFLASERYSGSVTSKILPVDNGKLGKLLYTPDGSPC